MRQGACCGTTPSRCISSLRTGVCRIGGGRSRTLWVLASLEDCAPSERGTSHLRIDHCAGGAKIGLKKSDYSVIPRCR